MDQGYASKFREKNHRIAAENQRLAAENQRNAAEALRGIKSVTSVSYL